MIVALIMPLFIGLAVIWTMTMFMDMLVSFIADFVVSVRYGSDVLL